MRSPRVPRAAVIGVILVALLAAACPGLTGPDNNTPTSTVEIAGVIYATQATPGGQPIDPVSGVVVSTSLSAVTATTDATGYFDLKTNAPLSSPCTPYTVTIAAPGHAAWSGTGDWGLMAVGQVFILSQLMGGPSGTCPLTAP